MRCTHCNAIIPEGWMRCPRCGKEVQIVPDYNPLDDVLTQEVKGSVEDVTRQLQTKDVRDFGRRQEVYQSKATRVLSQEELDEIQAGREHAARNRSRADGSQKTESAFDPVSGPVDFWSGVRLFSVSEFLCGKSGKRVRCTADERISDSRKILQTCDWKECPEGRGIFRSGRDLYGTG